MYGISERSCLVQMKRSVHLPRVTTITKLNDPDFGSFIILYSLLYILELTLKILPVLLIKCSLSQIIIFNLQYLGMKKTGTQEGTNKLCFMNDKLKSPSIHLCESLREEE